jgi:hypothetical protein
MTQQQKRVDDEKGVGVERTKNVNVGEDKLLYHRRIRKK